MTEATGTYSAERVERLLTCAICLDRFNNPKILPCQHTFCKSPCLEGLINMTTRLLRCPECRAEHIIPREGVDGYPTNITVSGFLDLPTHPDSSEASSMSTAAGSATKCGVCEAEARTSKCLHCNKLLCDSCRRSHSGQMKVDIGRLLNQIRKGLPKLSTSISVVEQKSETVKSRVELVKSEVTNTVERYIKELRDREKMLNSELETYLQGELRSLRLVQENVEVELASMSSFCDSTERLMHQADSEVPDGELVSMKKQCSEYIEQIQNTDENPVPEQLRDVGFTFDGQQLHSSIGSFGQLNITTPATSNRTTNNSRPSATQDENTSAQRTRTHWSDVEPLDTAIFEDFTVAPSFSYSSRARTNSPPRFRTSNATHYTRPTHSSADYRSYFPDMLAPSPDYMPSRTSDYMFRMTSPREEDMLDIMDRNRRDEISRRRVNRNPLFTAAANRRGRPHLMPDLPATSSDFGPSPRSRGRGLTPGATLMAGPSSYGSSSQNRSSAEDGNATTSRSAPVPSRAAADAAESRAAESRAAESGTAESRAAEASTILTTRIDARPAAAFIVPLDDGPVRDLQRRNQPERRGRSNGHSSTRSRGGSASEESQQQADVQQQQEAQSDRPPAVPQRGNGRRERRGNRRRSRNSNSQQSTNVGESSVIEQNESGSSTSSTDSQRQDNGQSAENTAGSSSNANNNSSGDNATTTTTTMTTSTTATATSSPGSSDEPPPAPGLGSRSRTFVCDAVPEAASNLPVVNGMSSAFEIPLTETIGDLDTSEVTSIHVEDSARGNRPIINYHMKGGMRKKLGGQRGCDPGQFTWPRGVAVSPVNDSLVVADSSNHRVQMFDLDGNFVSMFGSYGQSDGEFDCLAGIAINLMGDIIIADRYNHRIQVFDRYGQFSLKFGGQGGGDGELNYPWGVACDTEGFIYVCDKENNRIQVFQANGTFVRKFGSQGSRAGQLDNPHYATVSHDGKVIVSDCNNHRLQVFSNTGRFIKTIGLQGSDSGQLKHPKGVAVDRQGFIVVADSGNNRIQVFRSDGRYYCGFGSSGTHNGEFKGIEGVALTKNGDIIVGDKENHRVQIF
ncbi:hypothetical protein LSH36_589g02076 [Paralvinella palmiformis]|uniref:RING finger protein nhl-1 n=1 Tax=Paralvinella palmiformis TaxID=53620 RepID=A0AAD9MXL1_9ANNE|nr:hypothetical protein LSH36_589g02076 [Paralvinella palmiformis]